MSEFIWTIATTGRRAGKVLRAVDWLREDPENRVIIASSAELAQDLKDRFGLTDDQVLDASR